MGRSRPGGITKGVGANILLVLSFLACLGAWWASSFFGPTRMRVVVVDLSRSVGPDPGSILQEVYLRARDRLHELRDDDQFAIIGFGREADVVLGPASVVHARSLLHDPPAEVVLDRGASFLEGGLVLAASLVPDRVEGELILVSDGGLHDVNLSGEGVPTPSLMEELSSRWLSIRADFLGSNRDEDLLLDRVSFAPGARSGARIPIDLRVARIGGTRAEGLEAVVSVFGKDAVLCEVPVVLDPDSTQQLSLEIGPLKVGIHNLWIRVRPVSDLGIDRFPENDGLELTVRVGDGPTFVRVTRDPDPRNQSTVSSSIARLGSRSRSQSRLPVGEELDSLDAIILDDPSASSLLSLAETTRDLEAFVRRGGGLFVMAGPDSLGAGGWEGTPLEEVLPVWCRPADRDQRTVVFLLDVSGSMAREEKLRIAKEAIEQVVAKLNPRDRLGLLAFREKPELWTGLRPKGDGAGESRGFIETLAALSPGGGTRLLPALDRVIEELSRDRIEGVHLIVLSDGLDEEGVEDLPEFAASGARVRELGASLTVIATGESLDAKVLDSLGGPEGRRFQVRQPGDLLEILISDLGAQDRRELPGEMGVRFGGSSPEVRVDPKRAWPPVRTWIRVTAKEGSDIVLATESGDPLLTLGRVGRGRSVVFATHPDLSWAPRYREETPLIDALLEWGAGLDSRGGGPSGSRLQAWVESSAMENRIRVLLEDCPQDAPRSLFAASLRDPGAEEIEVPMTGPWTYEVTLAPTGERSDLLQVRLPSGGRDLATIPLPRLPAPDDVDPRPRKGRWETFGRAVQPVEGSSGSRGTRRGFRPGLAWLGLGLLLSGIGMRLVPLRPR